MDLYNIYYELLAKEPKQLCVAGISGQEKELLTILARKFKFDIVKKADWQKLNIAWIDDFKYLQNEWDIRNFITNCNNNKTAIIIILPEYMEQEKKEFLLDLYFKINEKLLYCVAVDELFDISSFNREIFFNKKNHVYNQNGVFYSSVTTLISKIVDSSFNWLKMDVDEFSNLVKVINAAAERGTSLHKSIEIFYNTNRNYHSFDIKLGEWWNWFLRWDKFYQPKILENEYKFIVKKLNFAGTIDAIGKIKDDYYILDWKTISQADPFKWSLQLHFYYLALLELKYFKKTDKVFLGIVHFRDQYCHFYKFNINKKIIELIINFLNQERICKQLNNANKLKFNKNVIKYN